ncbi:YSIRK-type signal peptide-containing protein, partial [Streptococcus infantis]|uniref:YSIRK-type signal peptide-containing protein n=2 Tax=Streptococcus TaxID=1301 RepID=UPI0039C4202A
MEKKSNSLSRVKRRQQEKVLRFSIRKYSFGAASVAVAALMFLGARVVSADSVTPVDKPHVEALTQDTSPLASQDKEEPVSSVKVDTAVASQLVAQIKDQLHVKEAANTDLLVTAKEELVKAEQTLADSKVSQEEVDALVARLTNVLDQLRAVEVSQGKEDKNGESTQEATPEIKPEVAKPTPEISAKSEETSENTNAEQLEKAKASLKVSIDRLEQAIAQTPENDLTREILEKAIAQVAVAKSAFGGVEVSLRDVEDMNRVIKRNESSVMIARNRLTSGRNDVRNGAAIPVGTTLRADAGATYDNAVGLYFTKEGDGSGYPAGTMLFRDRNQNTADKQRVKDVKDVVKVDVTKNGDTYDWVIEFEGNPENHQNAHAWFTIPTGHTLVDDGSASFGSYWGGSGGKRRIETQGRLPRNLYDIFKDQVSSTSKDVNIGTPGGAIEQAWGKAATTDAFWKGADGEIKTFEEIISKPDTLYFNRTGGARTTTEKDVLVSDYLKDWLIQHTQRVYHFDIDYRGRTKDSASNYIFRFKTKAAEGTPLMYAAGMRSYEFSTHRNDMQWYGLPSPKVTGADQTIEKGKEIRLEFTTKDNLAGFSLGDPKLGYNPADSIKLVDSKLELKDQKVEVQKVSDYEHKLIITGRVASDPGDYKVKVKSVNNVGQSAEFTSTVKVTQSITPTLELNQDPKTGDVTVTPKKPDGSTYPPETKVEIPGKGDKPIPVTIGKDGKGKVPNSDLPEGNVPGIGKITEPGQPTVEVPDVTTPAKITPRDTTPPKIYWLKDDGSRQELGYTHAAGQNVVIPLYRGDAVNTRLITIDDSGKVTDFRLENLQSGFSFTPVNGTATEESPLGQNVTGKVGLEVKKGKYTARAISTDGTNSTTGYFVFEIHEQAEKYPLEGKTETVTVGDSLKTWNGRVDSNQYTEAPKGRGVGVEWGWKGEAPKVVQDTAGVFKYTATATHPDKSVAESNPQVTIIVKPKAPTIETDLTGKAEVPNTEVVVNVHEGVKDGSTVTLYSPEGRAIGTGTVTNGKAKITGTIPVGNITAKTTVQTPGQPNVESELSPIKVATKIAETEKPGKIEITRKPNGDAVVTPKKPDGKPYLPGTKVEIPSKDKDGNPTTITVTVGDNGSGEVPNDNLPKKDVPGTGTVTEPNKKPSQPVDVTTPARKTPTIELDKDPKTGDVTVTPQRPGGGTYPPGTKVEIPGEDGPITVEIGQDGKGKVPNDKLPKKDVPGTGKITEPGKPAVEVPNVTTPAKVTPETPTTETPSEIEITRKPNGDAVVTPKKPDGKPYLPGTKVEIPSKDKDGNPTTITVTVGDNGSGEVPNDNLPKKDVPGTGTVTEPNKKPSQPVDVTTPARKTPTIELDKDPKTGDVTVTPQRPGGGTYPPGTKVEIPGEDGPITVEIGQDGKGKVPNDKLPKKDVPGTGKITEPGKPAVEVPNVTTPAKVTPETPETEKPGKIEITQQPNGNAIVTPKKPDGSTYPPKTTVEIPGENGTTITVTIGDNGSGEVPNDNLPKTNVPGTGKVTEPNKKPSQPVDVTTPARKIPTIELKPDPKTGDVTVTPQRPGGGTYPPGTKVEIPGENGPITVEIGQDGKGKVPNDKLPKKDVPGTGKITEPGKPAVEVPNVTTPAKVTPETPETEKPGKIEITQQPNGNAIVTPKKPDGSTYPSKTKVEIPGENGTTITVTIGDNGSGEVPNDKLPKKDVPGTGTVTEPNKKPSQPVDVTTPAQKTPTLDVEQDPKTGEVTVTPKKPDGSTYPPGTTVEIPGEDGPITVEIGQDGKGKVPNDKLPKKDVPGTGKITEPGKPAVEVPVETPAKVTPNTPTTETPSEIEITRKPNGDAVVTPKKPDGSTYPPGTTVEIPGEDGPITVEIGQDGKGKVPNDKLPKKDVPGKGTVTEPNKKPSQPVDVTTPAQKTPTVDVEQDPKTGDVTVTPQRPGGGTYPPGTTVEIPGEDGTPITVEIGQDGKGKVPNDKLPKKDVPGTGKITEPGKPAVEVPVETP